jgi:hypothetical protein
MRASAFQMIRKEAGAARSSEPKFHDPNDRHERQALSKIRGRRAGRRQRRPVSREPSNAAVLKGNNRGTPAGDINGKRDFEVHRLRIVIGATSAHPARLESLRIGNHVRSRCHALAGRRLAPIGLSIALTKRRRMPNMIEQLVYSMTDAVIATPSRKSVSVRNRNILLGLLFAGCGGLAYFLLKSSARPGWPALALSILCAWLFLLELPGVFVTSDTLSFPRRPLRWFPIFSLWWRRIPLRELDEMTLLHPWWGLQVVRLVGHFGTAYLLFDTRKTRLKFFDAVKAVLPHVMIYRTE